MHTGPMFTLDYIPLPADNLDGVEAAVPDTYADQSKRPHQSAFHIDEKAIAYHHAHKSGNQSRHRQQFPVILIYEQTQQLSEIDYHL